MQIARSLKKKECLHSMKTKDLRLQVFGAVSLGQISMFRSIVLPSSGSILHTISILFPRSYNFVLYDREDGGTMNL